MTEIEKLKEELDQILRTSVEAVRYVKSYFRRRMIIDCLKWWIIIISICSAVYYIDMLNWHASAIGRLVMINWILPIWDWRYLYNSRCLISASQSPIESIATAGIGNYVGDGSLDCNVCENIADIDRIENITFDVLQNFYLFRDLPVIIKDSHRPWPNRDNVPDDFIEFLERNEKLMNSIPCNVASNLFQTQNRAPKLRGLFRQIDLHVSSEWFLHFRNCDFDAVKASRTIMPYKIRPRIISPHLPPYRSSWILLSENYDMSNAKQLMVKDTVFVFQLSGRTIGELKAVGDCHNVCLDQEFELNAGESLVFNARMWNFFYRTAMSDSKPIVSFIQEMEID